MTKPSALLIIISGPSCTGKTTLARRLAEDLDLPLFCKDRFKELMFDEFNGPEYMDLAFSHRLGRLSFECVKALMEELARARVAAVIEGNFNSRLFSPFVQDLAGRFDIDFIRIQLSCDEVVRLERFFVREKSPERHPGHGGLRHFTEGSQPRPLDVGDTEPLEVAGDLFKIDTTDLSAVDHRRLLVAIRPRLAARDQTATD